MADIQHHPEPLRLETLAVHAGAEPDAQTGAMAPPIHLATTFKHAADGERIAGYEYQREGNPTQDRLETALAALEGGATALAFASGMAAITALLESLPNGSRILDMSGCAETDGASRTCPGGAEWRWRTGRQVAGSA